MSDSWLKFVCLVTGSDSELMRDSSSLDRITAGATAVLLLLVGALALTAWSVFFASFLDLYQALPLGLLVASLVFMLDRAMCASDWALTGVLQSGSKGSEWWGRLLMRIVVALMLALATSIGVLLAVFGDAINAHLQKQRAKDNAPLVVEYDQRKEQYRELTVLPLKNDLALLKAESEQLSNSISDRRNAILGAERRASDARIEAGRQRDGGFDGYVRGAGPLFRDAKRLETEAGREAERASFDVTAWQTRLTQLRTLISDKTAQLQKATQDAELADQRIEQRMREDARWRPERSGPLSRWMALNALRDDPEVGATVRYLDRLAKITLITLELTFLLCKVIFAPASVYVVLLRCRTVERALQRVYHHRAIVRGLRMGAGEGQAAMARRPPPMRILNPTPPGERRPEGETS